MKNKVIYKVNFINKPIVLFEFFAFCALYILIYIIRINTAFILWNKMHLCGMIYPMRVFYNRITIDCCRQNGIMTDYRTYNENEVINMFCFECNEEEERKALIGLGEERG